MRAKAAEDPTTSICVRGMAADQIRHGPAASSGRGNDREIQVIHLTPAVQCQMGAAACGVDAFDGDLAGLGVWP